MTDGPEAESAARRRAWPFGAALFSLALALAMSGYALDVLRKSRGMADWLMIVPAAVIGVVALAVSIGEDLLAAFRSAGANETVAGERLQTYRSVAFMVMLAAYVAAMPYAGFDVSTFIFLAAALFLQGERRPLFCLSFAALVTAVIVVVFVNLLRVRLHTIIF